MIQERIPRLVFVWLLLAQSFLLLPHLLRTPSFVLPLWLLCLTWRIMIFRGRWHYPKAWLKNSLALLSLVAIVAIERRLFSLDGMVLLLIAAFLLKLLEMRERRDLLIAIYLAYFVIATQMIFEQDLSSALYLFISLLVVTTSLVAAHIGIERDNFYHPVKVAGQLMLFSVPVMVAAFLIFPRIGPLWSMPSPNEQGRTGMTDSLIPGSISELAESDELVFRAAFTEQTPELAQLYWRGLVLDNYDGRRWSQARHKPVEDMQTLYTETATVYDYQQIMEPSQQRWMYPLDGVLHFDASADLLSDYSLLHHGKIRQRSMWQMQSAPMALKTKVLEERALRFNTRLPPEQNPQARALAEQFWQQTQDPEAFLQAILQHFNQQPFVYTLTPPLAASADVVDDFLFNTRRGFCEHYANAFVVIARSVNLPARLVVGYQGGDVNPFEKTVTVRQLDAHAWAEVWIEGKGWQRYDPTYAVAPERIEKGSQQALQQDPRFLAQAPFSAVKLNKLAWFKQMQYRLDQLNYLWHRSVLSYQGEMQSQLLQRLLGQVSVQRIMIVMASVFAMSATLLWLFLAFRFQYCRLTPEEKLYQRFVKKLARVGYVKPNHQGAMDFAKSVNAQLPDCAEQISVISSLYSQLRYADLSEQQKQRLQDELQQHVRQFQVKQCQSAKRSQR